MKEYVIQEMLDKKGPCIPYYVIMRVVVVGDVFEFIVCGRTNNGVVL